MIKYLVTILIGLIAAGLAYIWGSYFPLLLSRKSESLRKKSGAILAELHLDWSPWQHRLFYLSGPILSLVIALFLLPNWPLALIVGLLLLLVTHSLPYWIAIQLRKRRLKRIKNQIPDALSMVANALRSGLSLLQGFEMAAEELDPPLAQEFQEIISRIQVGSSLDESLEQFHRQVPLPEVELLVSSLNTLRETGANLIETLDIMIHTVREEQRVQSKIKTMTTQGVAQAVIICALPFFLAAAIYLVSPEYIRPLWSHHIGWIFIALMLLLQGLGVLIMKKILTIKV